MFRRTSGRSGPTGFLGLHMAAFVAMMLGVNVTAAFGQQHVFATAVEAELGREGATGFHGASVQRVLQRLYSEPASRALWTRDGRPTRQARAIVDFIDTSDSRGLVPVAYSGDMLQSLLAALDSAPEADAGRLARLDVTLSRAVLTLLAD